jgi:hypothetical protein
VCIPETFLKDFRIDINFKISIIPDDAASHPRRHESSATLLGEPELLHCNMLFYCDILLHT